MLLPGPPQSGPWGVRFQFHFHYKFNSTSKSIIPISFKSIIPISFKSIIPISFPTRLPCMPLMPCPVPSRAYTRPVWPVWPVWQRPVWPRLPRASSSSSGSCHLGSSSRVSLALWPLLPPVGGSLLDGPPRQLGLLLQGRQQVGCQQGLRPGLVRPGEPNQVHKSIVPSVPLL